MATKVYMEALSPTMEEGRLVESVENSRPNSLPDRVLDRVDRLAADASGDGLRGGEHAVSESQPVRERRT